MPCSPTVFLPARSSLLPATAARRPTVWSPGSSANWTPGKRSSGYLTVIAPQYFALPAAAQVAQVQPSVVGGITATVGAWPWQVAIIDTSAPDDFTGQYCGGTLIAPEWVLTAASCVDGYRPSELAVVLGRQQLSGNGGQRLGVVQIVINPDYDVCKRGWLMTLHTLTSTTLLSCGWQAPRCSTRRLRRLPWRRPLMRRW